MTPYSISCSTCNARLKVRDERAIGQLSLCPKCGSMVMITPPSPDGGGGGAPAGPQSDSSILARGPQQPAGSSPQLVVGGGALGSEFDDAAALLADTMDDVQPSSTRPDQSPNENAATEGHAPSEEVASLEDSAKPPSGESTASASNGATTTPHSALRTPHFEPPPIEPPTESMSSIELDPGAAAGASPLAQAGAASALASTQPQAGAMQGNARPHADATSGAAMPPPVAQAPWITPAQLAWQRYGMIGAGALAAIVMVGGLLAFLLRGPAADPIAEAPPADVQPIPDPDNGARDAAPVIDNEDPAIDPPKDNDGPADDRTPDDLHVDGPVPPTDGSGSNTPQTPDPPSDKPPTDAPPLFVDDGPADGVDNPLDEPTADTGLGDLAPLIDAFPLPPVSPTAPREGEPSDTPAPVPTETVSRPRPDPVNVNASARLADELASFDTGGAPLVKVVELITQMSTIPITISPDALAQRKLRPDAPVSVALRDSSVDEILKAVLADYKLAYEIRGDQIVIVSATSLRKPYEHAIDDLVADEGGAPALAERIQALIAPHSWNAAGGEGTIATNATKLTIKNEFDVQFHVHVFLQKLRVARGLPPRSTFSESMFVATSRSRRAAKKLQTPVRAVFHVEQPLVRVLSHLERAAGVTFLVDWQALGEVGWPPSSDAAVVADDVPLAEALEELLGPMDLTYRAIDESTIQITSLKALTTEAELEIYPITDALAAKEITPEELIAELKNELGAGLFVEGGGPFEIRYDGPSKSVLVRLPQAQQRMVEELVSRREAK